MMKNNFLIIIIIILISICAIGLISGIFCIPDYVKYKDNALSVDAVVTHHKVEEPTTDDSTTDYISYIEYTVDGKVYSNIMYENTSIKSKLTPIGTTVTVKVNPENPKQLMSSLGTMILISGTLVSLVISYICGSLYETFIKSKKILEENLTVHDKIYLYLKYKNKSTIKTFLIVSTFALIEFFLYLILEANLVCIISIIAVLIALFTLIRFLYKNNKINKSQYNIINETLIDKEVVKNNDSEDEYYLSFSSENTSWKHKFSSRKYNMVEPGTIINSVYLNTKVKILPEISFLESDNYNAVFYPDK